MYLKLSRTFRVSRTVYYKYKKRYLAYGIEGLKDKERSKPKMPNKVRKEIEEKVLDMAKRYPTYGPSRLANELGGIVCPATCYNILKRHGLATKLDRLLSFQELPIDIKISPILLKVN